MPALRTPDHTIFNTPGTEGTVEGVSEQCYGKEIKIDPPGFSHEITQHYGESASPEPTGIVNGQEPIMPSVGSVELKGQGDQRNKGEGRGSSNPTPAMPGA